MRLAQISLLGKHVGSMLSENLNENRREWQRYDKCGLLDRVPRL